MVIDEFRGDYEFLSNMFECPVKYGNMMFKSSEAAYQSAKFIDPEFKKKFARLTGYEAKRLAQQHKSEIRSDWYVINLDVMYEVDHDKFWRNGSLRNKLLATGNKELIEGNNWKDKFWGVYKGKGENNLGKIHMRVRTEFKNKLHK